MDEQIEIGSRVDVIYDKGSRSMIGAVVVSMPRGPGDLLHVKHNEYTVALNPYARDFISLRRYDGGSQDDAT